MKTNIITAIKLTFLSLILFVGIYTTIVWLIAQCCPNHGKGATLTYKGKSYVANIGQSFTNDKYFWSRPSAVDYNAASSGGSNAAAANTDYLKIVKMRLDTFLKHNPSINKEQVPVELLTASGSGLGPHISPKAALVQIKRIATIRHIRETDVQQLIEHTTEPSLWGILGPKKINVLKLNIALDNSMNNDN